MRVIENSQEFYLQTIYRGEHVLYLCKIQAQTKKTLARDENLHPVFYPMFSWFSLDLLPFIYFDIEIPYFSYSCLVVFVLLAIKQFSVVSS